MSISSGSSAKNRCGYLILAVVFAVKPLLIILDYQQWHTFSGSETTSDCSLEPL
jgi:hypothetical protein